MTPWLMALSLTALVGGTALAEAPAPLKAPPAAKEAPPAKPSVKKPHLTATLLTDRAAVAPGESFRVGVRYTMDKHWHIYWIEPGEAGIPTKLKFNLPKGWEVGELQWPTPTDFMTGSIAGIGYVDEVVLFATVKVPATATPGESARLGAKTSWLVCEDSCIRGRGTLSVDVAVKAAGADGEHKALFDKFEALVPTKAPEGLTVAPKLSVDGVTMGTVWEVAIPVSHAAGKALKPGAFYASGGESLQVMQVTQATQGPGVPDKGFLVRIAGKASQDPSHTGDLLTGILVAKVDGKDARVAVDVKIPRLAAGKEVTRSEDPIFTMKIARADKAGAAADGGATAATAAAKTLDNDEDADDEEGDAGQIGFLLALLFAFVGGVILNAMPCVLPVLSIKILSLVEQSSEEPKRIRNHSYAYLGGILVTFAVVAAIMLSLGRGLGALNQYAAFNAWLGAIMLLFALSLFGVFEIVAPGANTMNDAIRNRHGYSSSFTYGMFAVLLGTPCTAPFLAPAIGAAVGNLPPVQGFTVIMMVGVGLAFPFLIIGHMPSWSKWIPKPGAWMETFKKLMGFALVGTTLWMIWIVGHMVSLQALMYYLFFLGLIGFAGWVYGHWGNIMRAQGTRIFATVLALGMIIGGQATLMGLEKPQAKGPALTGDAALSAAVQEPIVKDGEIQWRDFIEVDVEALAKAGSTVFIDFTAEWCATCKVYEASVIDTDTIRDKMVANNVIPVKADWTNEHPKITEWLKRFNRAGVPMYLIIPANRPNEPIKLKDHLTTKRMLKGLKKAGPSQIQVTQR